MNALTLENFRVLKISYFFNKNFIIYKYYKKLFSFIIYFVNLFNNNVFLFKLIKINFYDFFEN